MAEDMPKRQNISRLIRESWANNDPTGWFEAVYASAANGTGIVPWAHRQPHPAVARWLEDRQVNSPGCRALVVGCGLGDDAEALAQHGFDVTAFDVSPTAIALCQERFPESAVNYRVADLLDPPAEWRNTFDFVLENRTIQSLPHDLCEEAIAGIAGFTAPGGTLLVACHGRDPDEAHGGIPWPLSRTELAHFEEHGLEEQNFGNYTRNGLRLFRVEYEKT